MDRHDSPPAPSPRRRPTVWALVLLSVGCAPTAGEGPGHRAQRLALSPQQEYQLGVKAYQEVLREAEQKNALVTSGPAVNRVTTVGRRIAAVATGESRMSRLLRREINLHIEGYRFDWEFAVIRSNQVNAFCLPGGKVAVFTGLLDLIDHNGGGDDWLATVLGHEIAHALAHHASERLAHEALTERAAEVVNVGVGAISPAERDRLLKVLAVGGRFGSLPFDRRQESEADHIGVFLMTFAGYDPRAAVIFWEAMASRGGGHVPEILSDHPSDGRRIAQLRQWAEQALAAKRAYEAGNTADSPR
ncbi:MAG TPA: M48 family metallopeptidase [Gemmataceae bacterium]|jgi:predicted Zn-dependent protease|nr:M48 family metallopeptidase [Gemmataceae bacterium]